MLASPEFEALLPVLPAPVRVATEEPCAFWCEDEAGETQVELREFGGFKQDRKAMAEWVASFQPQQVVIRKVQ